MNTTDTFETIWPLLVIPAEYDSMDECDQARWKMVLRQAYEIGSGGQRADDNPRYWLCCGSYDPRHASSLCYEAQMGYPEQVRFGTAKEHAEWQTKSAKPETRAPTADTFAWAIRKPDGTLYGSTSAYSDELRGVLEQHPRIYAGCTVVRVRITTDLGEGGE